MTFFQLNYCLNDKLTQKCIFETHKNQQIQIRNQFIVAFEIVHCRVLKLVLKGSKSRYFPMLRSRRTSSIFIGVRVIRYSKVFFNLEAVPS